ncbi:hypothetical protein [Pandoraea terrae]|uniref:hypothetical protein n=1 Tax=Pandoraea terrae TaxID=1537710 RepID=UPI0017874AAB|nr:hypothetical protein [Pandoraea terrae]
MKKFIATNGREVLKTITESGVTGYMDASIRADGDTGLAEADRRITRSQPS